MNTFVASDIKLDGKRTKEFLEKADKQITQLADTLEVDKQLTQIAILAKNHAMALLEEADVTGDPNSPERFSDILRFWGLLYTLGDLTTDDSAVEFHPGKNTTDWVVKEQFDRADEIKFRSGKTMPTKDFMRRLSSILRPDGTSVAYDKVSSTKGLDREMAMIIALITTFSTIDELF